MLRGCDRLIGRSRLPILVSAMGLVAAGALLGESTAPLKVWPQSPPGPARELPPEVDRTSDTDDQIAGRRVIRLTNVSQPTLHVFKPAPDHDTGASVVICPGGGHYVLAYDLEGTEVAEWLNSIGVTGIVLKYRVPAADRSKAWEAAVQDAQRAMSLVRHRADELKIDPQRIGILGFSAGGQTAALTSLMEQRQYDSVDEVDDVSFRPNFAVLVYPAGLVDREKPTLRPEATVTTGTPPMFFVHAYDDRVPVDNCLVLSLALKQANIPSEVHTFATGGHGFGLRPTDEPCTHWPALCERWLRRNGWLAQH